MLFLIRPSLFLIFQNGQTNYYYMHYTGFTKNNFSISQAKHMFWVLKKNIKMIFSVLKQMLKLLCEKMFTILRSHFKAKSVHYSIYKGLILIAI